MEKGGGNCAPASTPLFNFRTALPGLGQRGLTPSLHLSHVPVVTSQITGAESGTEIISITSHLNIFGVCRELIASKMILSARDCPR